MPKKQAATQTVRYRGVNIEALKKVRIQTGQGDFFSLKDFDSPKEVRILPPRIDEEIPWVEHWQHFCSFGRYQGFSLDGSQRRRSITCLQAHKDEACPVCDAVQWARENDEPEMAKALSRSRKFNMNIVDLTDGKVKVWSAPAGVAQAIQNILTTRYPDLCDPRTGRNLTVTMTGSKESRNYPIIPDDKRSPIKVEEWEKKTRDLRKLVVFLEPSKIIEALYSNVPNDYVRYLDEIFADVVEKPSRAKAKVKGKGRR